MSLAKAIRIASVSFEKKCDKNGEPYILHCLEVMSNVKDYGTEVMIAGVLHDLIEDDKKWSTNKLLEEGFLPETVNLIDLLTHKKKDSYEEYIDIISTNTNAIYIKMADLTHNSKIGRTSSSQLTDKDCERIIKYHKAFLTLKNVLNKDKDLSKKTIIRSIISTDSATQYNNFKNVQGSIGSIRATDGATQYNTF